jgi:hypothetical protein
MSDPVVIEITEPVPQPVLVTVAEGGAGPPGPPGPAGPPGPGTALSRRHANADGFDYCGRAPAGSAEDDAVWTVRRITVAPEGSVTAATAGPVKWTDRETASYT